MSLTNERDASKAPDPAGIGLDALFEAMPVAAYVKDAELRYVAANAAFRSLVGKALDELLGKRSRDVLGEACEGDEAADRRALAERGAADGPEATFGGSARCFTLRRAADADGARLVGVLVACERAEDARRDERRAVVARVAGGLAHQIRNPLATIKNAAYLVGRLAAVEGKDSDLARSLEIIRDEVTRANQLIGDLVDFARPRAPTRTRFGLESLVNEVLRGIEAPRGVSVDVALAGVGEIAADAGQLRGALHALARNAFDALRSAGGTLRVTAHREGDEITIVVEDDGPGVAAEVVPRLFEPMTTSKPNGLGLGLVTARALVANQGGTLAHEPAERGARFVVRLPVAG